MIAEKTKEHTSQDHLEEILDYLNEWLGERPKDNLRLYARRGELELVMRDVDFQKETWDGELLIRFKRDFTAREVINFILPDWPANEMSYLDDNTLRLWWD